MNSIDVVNEAFEKMAGVKEELGMVTSKASRVLGGKDFRAAVKDARTTGKAYRAVKGEKGKVVDSAYNYAKGLAKNVHAGARNKALKEGAKTYGARVAVAAPLVGAGALALKKKDKEKTAFDIVNDAFEKQAGVKEGLKSFGNTLKGKNVADAVENLNIVKGVQKGYESAYGAAKKGLNDKIRRNAVPGTINAHKDAFNAAKEGLSNMGKATSRLTKEVAFQKRKTLAARAGVGAGVGATAIGAGALATRKKKEQQSID